MAQSVVIWRFMFAHPRKDISVWFTICTFSLSHVSNGTSILSTLTFHKMLLIQLLDTNNTYLHVPNKFFIECRSSNNLHDIPSLSFGLLSLSVCLFLSLSLFALKSLLCFPLDIDINDILNYRTNYLLRKCRTKAIANK